MSAITATADAQIGQVLLKSEHGPGYSQLIAILTPDEAAALALSLMRASFEARGAPASVNVIPPVVCADIYDEYGFSSGASVPTPADFLEAAARR